MTRSPAQHRCGRSMRIAVGSYASPAKSTESGLLEVAIGLDDFAQLIFRGAITAIGVGMVAFHQLLEPRLDVRTGRAILQPERVKRLAFCVAHGAPLGLGARLCRTGARTAELPQDAETILETETFVKRSTGLSLGTALAADHPDPPSRKMSGERVLLKARNRVVAHAIKKIIGLIVFAGMLQAEPPVFAFAIAALRRPVARRLRAVRPVTAWLIGPQPPIFAGLDPDAIIQR